MVGGETPAEIRSRWTGSKWSPRSGTQGELIGLYAHATGGFSVARLDQSALQFNRDQIWDGLRQGGRVSNRGLIEDVVSWQLRESPEYHHFLRALSALAPDDEELKLDETSGRAAADDVREVPMLLAPYGRLPVTHASAGVQRILQLAYLLVWSWGEAQRSAKAMQLFGRRSFLFVVDEVEAHLHPRWQRQILPALRRVCDDLSMPVQLLVSTHSPLIMSSIDPVFDPEVDSLLSLELAQEGPEEGHPIVSYHEWSPRSDAAAWLGSEAFQSVPSRPPEVLDQLRTVQEAIDSQDGSKAMNAYAELARFVSSQDADLLRIRRLLIKQGWYEPRFSDGRENST